jgi:hypothetical protein
MDFTFYIASMEMFRVYKLFSISCRCNVRYTTPEEARNFAYNLCDEIRSMYKNVYVETVNENKIIVYIDDGNEKHAIHTIFTINTCESISNNGSAFMYRGHKVEILDESWVVSLEDGPIMGFETLDSCLDFIDYSMVTRDNIIRVRGDHMMGTPSFNKGKPVS